MIILDYIDNMFTELFSKTNV